MRRILPFILSFVLLFSLVPLNVYASNDKGSDDDDYIEEELAKRGYIAKSYDDIIDMLNHIEWNGNQFVITNLEGVSNGTKSPKKAIQDIGYALQNDSIIDNIFKNNIDVTINNQNGYVVVRCIPFSLLSSLMPHNHMSPALNVCANQKLTIASGGLHPYRDASASVDISDYTFIMDINEHRYDWNTLYNNIVGYNTSYEYYNRFYVVTDSFNKYNYPYTNYQAFGAPTNMTSNGMSMYGCLSRGDYWSWNCFVYSDQNYSTVPMFTDTTAARLFLNGQSPFYNVPYLTTIDPDDLNKFDFDRLRKELKNAIDNGEWVTPNDLQYIINETILKQLERMGYSIEEILFNMVTGLFDSQGVPYLLIISEQLDYIIDNNDLSVTNAKLQQIIDLLAVNNIPSPPEPGDDWLDILAQLQTMLQAKFPFSIVNDVQIITLMLSAEPIKPDLTFTVDLPFMDDTNEFTIDLIWFDSFRDYFFAFVEIGFVIFLLVISTKIISSLKE